MVLKSGKYFIFFLLLILVSSSCDKINESPIPDVHVFFTVNLIIANELNVAGNSVFFPNFGYGGVIVYCETPGTYYAFDAACTNEARRSCILKNESIMGECTCCESQFFFVNGGYPSQGPATLPLKQYNVSVVNDFTIRVYN